MRDYLKLGWLVCLLLFQKMAMGAIGGTASGLVLEEQSGSPIAGARIILFISPDPANPFELPVPIDTVFSDSIGGYVFENLGADINYRLVANASGYYSTGQNFFLHHTPFINIDLLLKKMEPPTGVIKGNVKNAKTGEPISGLYMALISSSPGQNDTTDFQPAPPKATIRETRSDANGNYEFTQLHETHFQNIYSLVAGRDSIHFIQLMDGQILVMNLELEPDKILGLTNSKMNYEVWNIYKNSEDRLEILGPASGFDIYVYNITGELKIKARSKGAVFNLFLPLSSSSQKYILQLRDSQRNLGSKIFLF